MCDSKMSVVVSSEEENEYFPDVLRDDVRGRGRSRSARSRGTRVTSESQHAVKYIEAQLSKYYKGLEYYQKSKETYQRDRALSLSDMAMSVIKMMDNLITEYSTTIKMLERALESSGDELLFKIPSVKRDIARDENKLYKLKKSLDQVIKYTEDNERANPDSNDEVAKEMLQKLSRSVSAFLSKEYDNETFLKGESCVNE